MGAESWFRNLWRSPHKHESGPQKMVIGVIAFELASLMAKLVHLWQSLNDKQIVRLREEIMNSVGIKKLVSDDDDYIAGLICAEMIENMGHVARSVARLGKKCNDPDLRSLEHVFDDLIRVGVDPYGWEFSWKKMERKVKKMERLISVNANLYQEMEMLGDLEQTLKRMKGNYDPDSLSLFEIEKKVAWKRQEVKNLQEVSLWNRTYDYMVRLLARSLFTIYSRIKHVFGIRQAGNNEEFKVMNTDSIHRSHSVSSVMQSSIHPSENSIARFSSGPPERLTTRSGPISRKIKNGSSYSGPLGSSTTKSGLLGSSTTKSGPLVSSTAQSGPLVSSTTQSGPISGKNKTTVNFYSGLFGKSTTKSGLLFGTNKTSVRAKKVPHQKHNRLPTVGPFKGCIMGGNNSPVRNGYLSSGIVDGTRETNAHGNGLSIAHGNGLSIFTSKYRLLNAPPETLGSAALALHYANVIIVIEKLAASPHLIGHDAREDLYNMLPSSIRSALRARLKPYSKSVNSSLYDTALAEEWSDAMTGILDWLAPLAHNMIRWQSERSVEQQNFVSRTNVLLVQTLYFANQEKVEATITELLVGLNYVWRFGREVNARALLECASSKIFDEYLDIDT